MPSIIYLDSPHGRNALKVQDDTAKILDLIEIVHNEQLSALVETKLMTGEPVGFSPRSVLAVTPG